ncbi:DUF488 domain-containing protein [Microterricola viridarii]|uniref:MarR family transcriptional regulator n=1 Tax=Microterricola viridarii TaxID=412690 RepID=A0A0X8E2E9_9MICO|nr:DUF488 family protein [Microterricola viridarii]AMB59214.1 MarR family transcriptional regulator [Microterricola viridarii]
MAVLIKRAYADAAPDDGCRVLVDRLWPRGVSRERAALTLWLKDAAPSPALRTWWGHDPARLGEFAARYRAELASDPAAVAAVERLRALAASNPTLTLVYGARDPQVNHAAVLRDYLADSSD